MRCARISIHKIDFQDNTFCLTSFEDQSLPDELIDSIKRVGILHPPILKEKSTNSYLILTGRKRLCAARDVLRFTACNCRIVPMETPEIDCLAIVLEEALASEGLTPVEKAVFMQKSLQWIDEQELIENFLPVLGLTPHSYHIQRTLALLSLEEPILRAVHEGRLEEGVARELCKLGFGDRIAIYDLIDLLRLSVGNQKKITTICKELSARNNDSIRTLLAHPDVSDILNHRDANPPQKTANLMAWLTKKRFPRLSAAESDFRKFSEKLALPKGVTLSHSPSFEKDTLTLSIPFQNPEALQKTWEKLAGML